MMESMKDSGVEWIGEIPSDWEITKIKYISTSDDELVTQMDISAGKQIRYVDIGSVSLEKGISEYQEVSLLEAPSRARKKVKIGDTIVSTVRTYLKAITYIEDDVDVVVSTGFSVLSPKIVEGKFFNFTVKSESFTNQVDNLAWGIAYPSINNFSLTNIKIAYPKNMDEQQNIANFLDVETKKLGDVKAILQQQIEKLKEYRKSLIWETVTKGLDKTVPMKDSGVEWIGEIPESWEVKPIKYIYEIIGSGTTPKSEQAEFYDGGINWIQSGDLYQVDEVNETTKTITELGQISSTALKTYESPFIAVAMYGASVGNLAISRIDATVNQAVAVMKDSNLKVYFGKYALEASKQELINAALGGTQPNISQMLLRSWLLPQPNLENQKSIANFLDGKTSIIEKTISNIQSRIEIIDKQEKTLIYDYVTGKRRVE